MPHPIYKKTSHTINSPTQRKIRKLEGNIINETLNSNISSNKPILSNEPTSEIIENVLNISMDANLSNDSDLEEINFASSSENENNEFLPLLEQEFLNNNDDNTDTEKSNFKKFLTSWAVKENIAQASLRSLLKEIKQYTCVTCHYDIPSDSRTLLCTPSTNIRNCDSGEYYHFGLLKAIENSCSSLSTNLNNIKISINIDGLPLAKSSQ